MLFIPCVQEFRCYGPCSSAGVGRYPFAMDMNVSQLCDTRAPMQAIVGPGSGLTGGKSVLFWVAIPELSPRHVMNSLTKPATRGGRRHLHGQDANRPVVLKYPHHYPTHLTRGSKVVVRLKSRRQ